MATLSSAFWGWEDRLGLTTMAQRMRFFAPDNIAAWWQEQLDLCLIGIMATFGWEKALGDAGELSW